MPLAPSTSVPMSTLWPALTKTLGRWAVAVTELATGPAATVRYWPAGAPASVRDFLAAELAIEPDPERRALLELADRYLQDLAP